MVEGGKIWVFGVLVSLVLMRVAGEAAGKGLAPCNFPAVYNFGDSNSDTGAFSAAVSPAQLPDGQTFFGKPAGRVCDGRLIIDFIAEELGIPYLSPYLDSVGSNFSHGANFAYSGATILRQTWQSGIPFDLAVQATQFSQFKARTIDISNQGKNTSRLPRPEDFSKALYTLDIGQNDVYTSTWSSNPLSLFPDLINNFTLALQTLYDQGGRAFWIHNVGPNGCLPAAQNNIWNRTQETFDKNGCINRWNERVVEYNRQLKDRVIKLRADLPEAAITYVDVYTAKYNLISNAKNLGFAEPLKQCKNGTTPCENPSSYISWDGVHYTEAANHFVAKNILNGSLSDPPVSIAHACHKNKLRYTLCIFIRAVALNIAKRKMEGGKIWVFGVLVSSVLMRVAGGAEGKDLAPCDFPAVYNFGDSNSDTGAFSATASPTQLPDGQTFFRKPAGRGCDGRLIIDFIAEELGIPYLSPYLDSVGSNFSHGANFAYGGATILRQTWQSPGIPFHLAVQARQFSQFKARTIDMYKQGKNTSRLPRPEDFSEALYTLDIGQNDVYTSTWSSNPLSLIPDLINNFTLALQTLYDQGGRAFWIHNVGPNGCLPAAQNNIWNRSQETFDKNGCINSWNERVVEYNRQLKDRAIKLRALLPEAAITYVDVYTAKYNLISNAKNLGNDLVPKKKPFFFSSMTGCPGQLTRTSTNFRILNNVHVCL
ncbi:hypothetical protein RHMOL_Rhmol10G0018800 [Rhododendron molle]|uniref:Uncharacterized protein n=1 Tax=Rhododendron molle TaxID=49168 RepID=A0ACC0LXN2_RHOML|nr:hypothetical protein RHMOL_Rhmol10G0018800 [Rhododendron molle]